jgi:hypothetical protein
MLVLNTTSPRASPGPVKDRQAKVRPSSSVSRASIDIRLVARDGRRAPCKVLRSITTSARQINPLKKDRPRPALFSINCAARHHPMGVFSTRSQMPQGQAPAQNPQPMQRSGLTTYSKATSSRALRLMAASGHMATQIPQSRQVPQEEHWEPHWPYLHTGQSVDPDIPGRCG